MASGPPPFDLLAYEPPDSLWKLVESFVPGSERHEIKDLLGESLVEQSLELHEEINMLLDIWDEYREETNSLSTFNRLPEPPAARERLKQEISFFVETIREKAKKNRVDPSQMLAKRNPEIIDYAMGTSRPGSAYGSRPQTARSTRDGRETPMRKGTPNSDGRSLNSTLSDEVESMNDKLNILKLDEVAEHLRQTLEDEVQQLLNDIAFLQNCLEEEADYRSNSSMSTEPSLSDLRRERSYLEKDLLETSSLLQTSQSNTESKYPTSRPRLAAVKPVTPPGGALRPTPPTSGSATRRTSPLKASHQLGAQILTVNHSGDNHKPSNPASSRKTVLKNKTLQSDIANNNNQTKDAKDPRHAPSPPKANKPTLTRPSSADRFRKMVLSNRDT